jgi:hypothetical protein
VSISVGSMRDPGAVPFDCPRCHQVTEARFYGPCPKCRGELRAAMGGEARDVERPVYEPSMNVTPNAVALKDD